MRRAIEWTFVFLIGFSAAVAASLYYFNLVPSLAIRDAKAGKLEGKLLVQWLAPDKFLFTPDPTSPLKFVRASGEVIKPERLVTDGGTVPRALWVTRSYSPWGYAPAFIVHDWLFAMKHCKIAGNPAADYKVAALIMAEVMKTMAAAKVVPLDDVTLISMHAAVSSTIARDYWEKGECLVEREDAATAAVQAAPAPKRADETARTSEDTARSSTAPTVGAAPAPPPPPMAAPTPSARTVSGPRQTAPIQYEIKF